MGRLRIPLFILAELLCISTALAAPRKDFKGLFGNYRREKFTENAAESTAFGMDLMMSTLFPLNGVVSSTEDRNTGVSSMPTSTFFNVEANFFFSLAYNWEIYANVGYYSFDTRKENTIFTDPTKPLFQQFEMEAIPGVLGVKYRFTEDDLVPYVGVGVGMAWVKRRSGYDYNTVLVDEEKSTCIVAQISAGIEFYFHPRAGLRLETSAYHFRLPSRTYDPSGPSGNAATSPIITYTGNPWMLRYASGVFFLF